MEITGVRISLIEKSTHNGNERLRAFASITFDDAFVVHDIKVIEDTKGLFISMPSRKLTDHCSACGCKNHLQARFCNHCGFELDEDRAIREVNGRVKLHGDIAHPINSAYREKIAKAILDEYVNKKKWSEQPNPHARQPGIKRLQK